jgi:preprotein translocase subunit SecB
MSAAEVKPTEQKTNFSIQRIYIKGSSFDAPLLPKIFKENLTPKIDMQVQTHYSEIEPTVYEAVLTLDLTNKAEEKILWQIKLQQAGIFTLEGIPKEQIEPALYGYCMNLLYPYACEAVSNMAVRSGFVPVYLIPMNFEALYQEQKRQQAEAAKTNGANNSNGAIKTKSESEAVV